MTMFNKPESVFAKVYSARDEIQVELKMELSAHALRMGMLQSYLDFLIRQGMEAMFATDMEVAL